MRSFKPLILSSLLVVSASALADDGSTGIDLGSGWVLSPSVSSKTEYDSNKYRQPDQKVSAVGVIIDPQLDVAYLTRDNKFTLTQKAQFGNFSTGSYDDYAHYSAGFEALVNQSGRHRLKVDASRNEGHDPFGTERQEALPTTLVKVDEFAATTLQGAYTFGLPTATLNLTAFGGQTAKRYTNNHTYTRYLDRKRTGGGGELSARISPRTHLLLDAQRYSIHFDEVEPNSTSRDGVEDTAHVGVQWAATAATLGRIRVGVLRRNMDAKARKDFSGFTWDAGVRWQPVENSSFTLSTSRTPQESYFAAADFIDVKDSSVSWTQSWTDRVTSQLGLEQRIFTFEGAANRRDTTYEGSAQLSYSLTRQITTGVELLAQNRNSNQNQYDYRRYVPSLRFDMVF